MFWGIAGGPTPLNPDKVGFKNSKTRNSFILQLAGSADLINYKSTPRLPHPRLHPPPLRLAGTRKLLSEKRISCTRDTQRAQYPLVKEYALNYIGLHIMI